MKRQFSKVAKLLLALGVLLQAAAGIALLGGPEGLQYSMPAPDVQQIALSDGGTRVETYLPDLAGVREDLEEELGAAVIALSCGGMRAGQAVSSDAKSAEAALYAVGERWLEINPRQLASGRWMDNHELENGTAVAVLDEDLAFQLFGSEVAEGKLVRIGEAQYRVVGTLRHRRGVGEADKFSAYIPLNAAAQQGVQLDTVTMYALPAAGSGLRRSLEAAMQEAWGPGSLHDLGKEAMGALMLSRVLAFALGMAILFRFGGLWRKLCARCRIQIAAKQAKAYASKWLPAAIWRIGLLALLGAGILLAGYGLLAFLIDPVYTFTEWVPESLVSLSALQTVFWSRTADAARSIQIVTPESAHVAFWGLLAQWGAVAFLLGLALGRKKLKKDVKTGNQTAAEAV